MSDMREAFELEMGFEMLNYEWSEDKGCYYRPGHKEARAATINDAYAMFCAAWQAALEYAGRGVEPVAHVFPDDLNKLESTGCAVTAYSVEMGDPDRGETVPLYTQPPAPVVPEDMRECYFCNKIRSLHWGDHEACPDIAPHHIDGLPDNNQRFRACETATPKPSDSEAGDD